MWPDPPMWKEKYWLSWCDLCNTASIKCPVCEFGSSCNGGSCKECHDDFTEFHKCRTTVYEYLTEAEVKVYQKCLRVQDFIMIALERGNQTIDWRKLREEGELSKRDEEIFREELKDAT